ncbi:MAG: hypothetical protein ACPGC9_02115 [Cytophagales bacterium]
MTKINAKLKTSLYLLVALFFCTGYVEGSEKLVECSEKNQQSLSQISWGASIARSNEACNILHISKNEKEKDILIIRGARFEWKSKKVSMLLSLYDSNNNKKEQYTCSIPLKDVEKLTIIPLPKLYTYALGLHPPECFDTTSFPEICFVRSFEESTENNTEGLVLQYCFFNFTTDCWKTVPRIHTEEEERLCQIKRAIEKKLTHNNIKDMSLYKKMKHGSTIKIANAKYDILSARFLACDSSYHKAPYPTNKVELELKKQPTKAQPFSIQLLPSEVGTLSISPNRHNKSLHGLCDYHDKEKENGMVIGFKNQSSSMSTQISVDYELIFANDNTTFRETKVYKKDDLDNWKYIKTSYRSEKPYGESDKRPFFSECKAIENYFKGFHAPTPQPTKTPCTIIAPLLTNLASHEITWRQGKVEVKCKDCKSLYEYIKKKMDICYGKLDKHVKFIEEIARETSFPHSIQNYSCLYDLRREQLRFLTLGYIQYKLAPYKDCPLLAKGHYTHYLMIYLSMKYSIRVHNAWVKKVDSNEMSDEDFVQQYLLGIKQEWNRVKQYYKYQHEQEQRGYQNEINKLVYNFAKHYLQTSTIPKDVEAIVTKYLVIEQLPIYRLAYNSHDFRNSYLREIVAGNKESSYRLFSIKNAKCLSTDIPINQNQEREEAQAKLSYMMKTRNRAIIDVKDRNFQDFFENNNYSFYY